METISYKLEHFEGPLDLLLHLIEKNKINIYDIPIVEITAQYLDYVCVNQLGELLRPSYVTDHFRELLEKYGLRHIRFHDLRHTFASLLINQDVPLINVSNFLGHSDLSTTANIYAHLDKASKQASAAVISDILQGENRHAQPKGEPETNTDRQT